LNIYGVSTARCTAATRRTGSSADWWIRKPRVEDRLRGAAPLAPVMTVEPAGRARPAGEWLELPRST